MVELCCPKSENEKPEVCNSTFDHQREQEHQLKNASSAEALFKAVFS